MKAKKTPTKKNSKPETIFWEKTSRGNVEKGVHVSFLGLGREATSSEIEWLHEQMMKKGLLLCQVGINDYLMVSDVKRANPKEIKKIFPKGKV